MSRALSIVPKVLQGVGAMGGGVAAAVSSEVDYTAM